MNIIVINPYYGIHFIDIRPVFYNFAYIIVIQFDNNHKKIIHFLKITIKKIALKNVHCHKDTYQADYYQYLLKSD